MNPQNHCVSLETAKRMKELGWVRETYFWWSRATEVKMKNLMEGDLVEVEGAPAVLSEKKFQHEEYVADSISAPIASEIMEELPRHIVIDEEEYTLEFTRGISKYIVYCADYCDGDIIDVAFRIEHDSFTEALALLWCTLREQGII